MRKGRSFILLLSVVVLLVGATACGGGAAAPREEAPAAEEPAEPSPTQPAAEPTSPPAEGEAAVAASQGAYDTVFPLPDDVQNFTGGSGEAMVNFQTSLTLEEVVEFYRQTLADQGLTEREVLTSIEDVGFSMVFDGWPNDRALVIQGVDLGGSTNVNIRFEDV